MTENQISNFANLAYPLCLEIPRQKKHVSLILHKNKIISIGRNYFKTHPIAKEIGYPFDEMHSELDAFRKVPKNLRDENLILLNFRFNQFGEMRMARPCNLCTGWCKEVFHTIYYSTNDGMQKMKF